MKKILSVILAITLVFASVSVIASAKSDMDLGFAVAADLHILVPEEELPVNCDNPLYPHANRRTALQNESSFILKRFLEQCAENDNIEFVLVPGDIGNDGRFWPDQHKLAAQIFREFEKKSGKQVYVINGNHDINDNPDNVNLDEFKEIYAEFGYDLALETLEGTASYTADLGKKYRLIALDSCAYNKSTADGVTEEKIQWVLDMADKAKADGRYPILMMHHNLLEHMPIQSIINKSFIIGNHKVVADRFANHGIKIVLTGHEHCSDVTSYTSTQGNVIYDFANTSLSMYPIEFRHFMLSDYEISYKAKEVQGIDTKALSSTVKGYTPEMIEAMDTDFNAYAKGFQKESIQVLIKRLFSDEQLGIPTDAIYYDLIRDVLDKLLEILELPLYGEGGLQELGKKYGIDIPVSQYENGWDVASELVCAHYAGEENRTYESVEVLIFLRTIALALREEFKLITGEQFEGAAAEVLKAFGTESHTDMINAIGEYAYGDIKAGEYLILSLVSPIILGFIYDDDGVNDNHGYLTGYGALDTADKITNMGNNASNLIEKFIKYIIDFTDFIAKAMKALT